MAAIVRGQRVPSFSASWTGMSVLGWATGSLLYLLTLLVTALLVTALLGIPFGRADIIIARELISFFVFGATIGLSQALVLARWNSPRWPPLFAWSLGLPLGWAIGIVLQRSWGLISVSNSNLVRNLIGYVLMTALAVGLLALGWRLSGRSVGARWFVVRILGAAIAIALVGILSFAVIQVEIPSYPFDLAQLVIFPLLVAATAFIGEGLGSRILAKEFLPEDGAEYEPFGDIGNKTF